jgi:hypothetical protein
MIPDLVVSCEQTDDLRISLVALLASSHADKQ